MRDKHCLNCWETFVFVDCEFVAPNMLTFLVVVVQSVVNNGKYAIKTNQRGGPGAGLVKGLIVWVFR